MKKLIDFVKGWRADGEPWSFYIFVPIVGVILIAAAVVAFPVDCFMKLLGFKDGIGGEGCASGGYDGGCDGGCDG